MTPRLCRTTSRKTICALSALLLVCGLGGASLAAGTAGHTEKVSVADDELFKNGHSGHPSVSADGRFVAYVSAARNMVAGDANGEEDIFVRDRQTGTTEIVSVASDGTQGNGLSTVPALSADGRFVAFRSRATNLAPGDANGTEDIFVHDRQARTTELVSIAGDGMSGNAASINPSISADGRFVAFASAATNLVGSDANRVVDVFVRDRQAATTSLVSVAGDGTQANRASKGPAISANGRFVAYHSSAGNLVADDRSTFEVEDVFVHDRHTGTNELVSRASDGTQGEGDSLDPAISAGGRFVAYHSRSTLVAGDSNGFVDVFVHDRQGRTTERVSISSDGTQANDGSGEAAISADGRFVAYHSSARNLVTGDTNGWPDVFVRDRQVGATERVSVASDGTQGNDDSSGAAFSGDERFVAFHSIASNLVAGDTNRVSDVFLRQLDVTPPDTTPPAITITTPADAATYNLDSTVPADYGCEDPESEIAACAGSVADGSPIDTTSLGPKSFTVEAENGVGLVAQRINGYTVKACLNLLPVGGAGNDVITGSAQSDQAFGRGGNDTIRGGASVDCLDGGGGADRILGDAGDDEITASGDLALDTIDCGGGIDTVTASLFDSVAANCERVTRTLL